MTIKVVTDSTCDLPYDVIQSLGITVLPCFINFPAKSYLDGVEVTAPEFYKKLKESSSYPTSAAPSLGTFTTTYRNLIDQGASSILSIHLSSKLASTYNNAVIAARTFIDGVVRPFDAGQLSLGTGLIVETAARLAKAGASIHTIIDQIQALSIKTYAYAMVDSLEYLRRSGRISSVIAGVGSILQVRPIVHIHKGKIGLDFVRTSRQGFEKMIKTIRALGPLEKLSVVHTNLPTEAERLTAALNDAFPANPVEYTVSVSPAIGLHFGASAVGFVAITSTP